MRITEVVRPLPENVIAVDLRTLNVLRQLWFVAGVGVIAEVVGRADGEDALVAADVKSPFQEAAALIVEKIFVPMAFYEFRDDDHNAPVRMVFRQIQNVLKNG